MVFRSHWPLRRTRRGVELHLSEDERSLLRALAEELQERLSGDDSDHADLRRLFPTAYHEDPDKDLEYQILARSELQDRRLTVLTTFGDTLDSERLTNDQVGVWMQAINQFRLVLGTQLDVSEDDANEDADNPTQVLYEYLGVLLEHLVRASIP